MKNRKRIIKKVLPEIRGMLKSCTLCPRQCRVDRLAGKNGYCRAGLRPAVHSYGLHPGEEPPVSGTMGSGTIFFTYCNMSCVYCQNYKFSQLSKDRELSSDELANVMVNLEKLGCHNINLVSPTHFVQQILEAIMLADDKGLSLPIVYNTGGYDFLDIIKLMDGVIDIYMPDMRYSNDKMASAYSNADGYVSSNRECVKEMYRQVGDLIMDPSTGTALRGLIVRCLVLPENISGTERTLEFISAEVSKNTYISMMSQYYPSYRASEFEELSQRITNREYEIILRKMSELGLENGWVQASPSGMDTRLGGHRIKGKI